LALPASSGGGSVHNLLRRLSPHCGLYLFCFAEKASQSELEALLEHCARLVVIQPKESTPALRRRWPAGVEPFQSPSMQLHLEVLLKDWQIPLIEVASTRLAMAGAWLKRAPVTKILAAPELRFVLDKQARESPLTSSAPFSRREAAMWRRYELRHLRRFDCIVTASDADREHLRKKLSRPLLRTVENGADMEHFRAQRPDPGEDQVLLVGGFEDAAGIGVYQVVMEQIWPRVRDARPQARLSVVAGEGYRQHWRRRFRRSLPETPPEVTVLGHVDDLRFLYERAGVVMALAAAGGGARVVEALAMGRAVVATKAACEGLAVEPGRDLLLAEEPAGLADAVAKLLANPEQRRKLGERGRAAVESRYDWSRNVAQRLEIYEELLRKKE
jgi:glycosyltransferase involved in cell wall biosynthesis